MFVFQKGILNLKKVISCAYPTVWGKFKNFIQIIRTSFTDKIVGYNIYAMAKSFPGRYTIYQSKLLFRYMMYFV